MAQILKYVLYKRKQGANKFQLFKKTDNKHRGNQFENWNFSVAPCKKDAGEQCYDIKQFSYFLIAVKFFS